MKTLLFFAPVPFAETTSKSVSRNRNACRGCKKPLAVRFWDRWNGFLVRCRCGTVNGKRMVPNKIVWGSLLLQPISFFLIFRPIQAFAVFVLYVVIWNVFLKVLTYSVLPILAEVLGMALLLGMPAFINSAMMLWHNRLLKEPVSTKTRAVEVVEALSGF